MSPRTKKDEIMKKKRSIGVTIFAIIFLILGLFDFYQYLPDLIQILQEENYIEDPDYWAGPISDGIKRYPPGYRADLVRQFIYSVCFVLVGIGLLLLNKWARYLTLVLSLIFIYYCIRNISCYSHPVGLRGFQYNKFFHLNFAGLIIFIFTFCFFCFPKIRKQFKKEQ